MSGFDFSSILGGIPGVGALNTLEGLFKMATSNPDAFAGAAAGAGIAPPSPGVSVAKTPDVGAALTGEAAGAPTTGWDATVTPAEGAAAASPLSPLSKLSGIKMPGAGPSPTMVNAPGAPGGVTPGQPQRGSIDQGELMKLLAAASPHPQIPAYELPSTLQRAVGGR